MPQTRSSAKRFKSGAPDSGNARSGGAGTADVTDAQVRDRSSGSGMNTRKRDIPAAREPDQRSGTKENRPVAMGEVIELSSDDSEMPAIVTRQGTRKRDLVTSSELRKKIRKLEKENSEAKQENLRIKEENLLMQAAKEADKQKKLVDVSKLEDNIVCEICESTLWSPFLLPECGHSFCQSCLEGWFCKTLTQHVAVFPGYVINAPAQMIFVQGALVQQQEPQYTCPKCRKDAKTRPAEDFSLKSLVRTITTAAGETSPKMVGQRKELWDRFFRAA